MANTRGQIYGMKTQQGVYLLTIYGQLQNNAVNVSFLQTYVPEV